MKPRRKLATTGIFPYNTGCFDVAGPTASGNAPAAGPVNLHFIMKTIAVYPGSFDPVTNGHIDLIQRSATIFDEVVVAILRNSGKTPLFSVDERKEMLESAIRNIDNVTVTDFSGLLVDFAERIGASVIIRGIRAISDYEYELQMAWINRRLASRVETVFMLPAETYSFLSSRLVKEIASHGGAISGLVPEDVERRLRSRFNTEKS
jgi:pantetheine-phosphate adenylyltransferase